MRNPPGKKIASGTETDSSFFFFPQQQKVSKNEPDEKDNISLAFLFLIFSVAQRANQPVNL